MSSESSPSHHEDCPPANLHGLPTPITIDNVEAWRKLHSLLSKGYRKLVIDPQGRRQVENIAEAFRSSIRQVSDPRLQVLLWDVCFYLPSALDDVCKALAEMWTLEPSLAKARKLDDSIAAETKKLADIKENCASLRHEEQWMKHVLIDARSFHRYLRDVRRQDYMLKEEIKGARESIEWVIDNQGQLLLEISELMADQSVICRRIRNLKEQRFDLDDKLARHRYLDWVISCFEESMNRLEMRIDSHFDF